MITLGLVAGIVMLLAGGAALVRGAAALARSAGVSPLVVGLTVVAFGTSAPELVVNLIGAFEQETQLAFGNVVGSNLANVGLVLGTAAFITPILIEGTLVRREIPLLLLATAVLVVMTLDGPLRGQTAVLDRSDAAILALLFTIFIYATVGDIMRQRADPLLAEVGELPLPAARRAWWLDTAYLGLGITLLALGGHLTITNGAALAEQLGLSRVLVGMLVVAIGTSLPELVTSIIAAMRKEADLCVGNVVGSNLFNCLVVLPASAAVAPIVVPGLGVWDLIFSFLLLAALIPIFLIGRARMGRWTGGLLILTYAAYVSLRVSG